MYTFEGLISQTGEITDNWALTYFCVFELAFFPARCIMKIYDLAHERAWYLDNEFFDYRSAQDPRNIQVPVDKLWESRLRTHLVGDLKLTAPAQTPGILENIKITLDLSWYPGWITLEWNEPRTFVRITTRAAPATGKWSEIDFDYTLLDRFEPIPSTPQRNDATRSPDVPSSGTRPRPPIIPCRTPTKAAEIRSDPDDESSEEEGSDLGSMLSDRKSSADSPSEDSPVIAEISSSAKPPPKHPEDLLPQKKEEEEISKNKEDHAIPKESVIAPKSSNSKPIVRLKAPPPECQGNGTANDKAPAPVTTEAGAPIDPPSEPVIAEPVITQGPPSKGKAAKAQAISVVEPTSPPAWAKGFMKGLEKGKGKTSTTTEAFLNLQRTMGKPPDTEAELFRRQVLAQSIEGLHPSLYNWLVFARSPNQEIPSQVFTGTATIESISDDLASTTENPEET